MLSAISIHSYGREIYYPRVGNLKFLLLTIHPLFMFTDLDVNQPLKETVALKIIMFLIAKGFRIFSSVFRFFDIWLFALTKLPQFCKSSLTSAIGQFSCFTIYWLLKAYEKAPKLCLPVPQAALWKFFIAIGVLLKLICRECRCGEACKRIFKIRAAKMS